MTKIRIFRFRTVFLRFLWCLHFADVEKLLEIFKTLNVAGHTVILAEHRSQIIASADYIIDLGPGRGEEGGNVVFQGKVKDILKCAESVTGKIVSGLIG